MVADMISYASWTRTKANLKALRLAGWRVLVSPDTIRAKRPPYWDTKETAPFALDNGAWGCFRKGIPFRDGPFLDALHAIGDRADWVVMPDAVGDAPRTLAMAREWWPELEGYRVLFAVQDGMVPADVLPWVERGAGIFIGGGTEWKLESAPQWVRLAHSHGRICHMGRVNSVRRIRYCQYLGIDSIDGTNATRFSCNLPRLDRAVRQLSLFGGE